MKLQPNPAFRAPSWRGALRWLVLVSVAFLVASLAGCEEDSGSKTKKSTVETPELSMDMPDSLTGGVSSTALTAAADDGPNCNYLGADGEDPFQNGYFMTKFLVGAVATWSCIADFVSFSVATLKLPTNGSVIPIGEGGDGEPTGVSVTAESADQLTVQLYYDGNEDDAGFYVSWVQTDDGVDGRMILTSDVFNSGDADEPTDMRMDFSIGSSGRTADMFIKFPDGNSHNVNGFRIDVTQDDGDETFLARGLLDFTGQWFSGTPDTITETPDLRISTISDFEGTGAASAVFSNAAVEFPLGASFSNRTLGWYLFNKDDQYFFDSDGNSDWINKQVSSALYNSGKTSTGSDDSAIEDFLNPPLAGGEIAACVAAAGVADPACEDFLNAVFSVGVGSFTEINDDTAMPGGFRGAYINGLVYPDDYLDSPYPEGSDSWDGVFDLDFNP